MKNRKRLNGLEKSKNLKRKLLKKKAKRAELKCKLVDKQKMFDFRPFDLSYLKPFEVHLVKQKMKTVVMVNGMLEGMHVKTRVPPVNVANNRWM